MELLSYIRILTLIIAIAAFLRFVTKFSFRPIRGSRMLGAGIALVALNMLIGAIFHSPILAESYRTGILASIGEVTGKLGMPTGLILIMMGTFRMVKALSPHFDQHYLTFVDHSFVGGCLIQGQKVVFASKQAAAMFGCDVDALEGMYIGQLLQRVGQPQFESRLSTWLQSGQGTLSERLEARRADGTNVNLQVVASRTQYQGAPAVHVMLVDLSKRMRAEETLKSISDSISAATGEAFFATLAENLQRSLNVTCSFVVDCTDRENRPPRTIASSQSPLVPFDLGAAFEHTICLERLEQEEFVSSTHGLDYTLVDESRTSSAKVECSMAVALKNPDGKLLGMLGILSENSLENETLCEYTLRIFATRAAAELERRRTDRALQDQVSFLQTLTDTIPNPIYYKDTAGSYIGCNRAFEEFIGISREELIGKTVYDITSPDSAATHHQKDLELLESTGKQSFEGVARSADGTRSDVIFNKAVFKHNDGSDAGVLGVILDITAQKETERKLRESEAFAHDLFDNAPDIYCVLDRDGNMSSFNKRGAVALGWEREELIGKPVSKIIHPNDQRLFDDAFTAILEQGNPGPGIELRHVKRDGTVLWVSLEFTLRRDEAGEIRHVRTAARDITSRRHMEEELLKATKLESLGVLAGGIAHDFNNILTAVTGNISLARLETHGNRKLDAMLLEIDKAAQQARRLTRQLLTFAKGGAPVKRPVSVRQLIEESVGLALRGSNVGPTLELPEDLMPVDVDYGQISQVLHNLVLNADEAMPNGGTIRVSANPRTFSDANIQALAPGTYICVKIEDTGVGIPQNHLNRIFDPYFSTKQRGSGLGLATSYSILKKHGGHIDVESELGRGTTFYLYLPVSDKPVPDEVLEPTKVQPLSGRVLLMDDEDLVLRIAGRMLQRMGLDVAFARNGSEALTCYREAMQTGDSFDLVIMDLTIRGGMGGAEAVRKLREIDRDARVIVSSGYSENAVMADFAQYGFDGVLSKPYVLPELSRAIESALDENVESLGAGF